MKKYFGNWSFYKKVILISLPIMLQQGITSFVNLLDNIMVGNYNVLAMTGVGITNQLFFIVNILTVGALAAAGIFLAQFFGAKNKDGMIYSFRIKLWIGLGVLLIASITLLIFGDGLINTFLTNPETEEQRATILGYSKEYLLWIMLSIAPFIVSQIYSSSLRELGETVKPMIAGTVAVVINLVFNYLLISGNLGFPEWGVKGAAIATTLARLVEMTILIVFTHRHKQKFIFIDGAYKTLKVPKELALRILRKGLPLMANEFLWSLGMTVLVNLYSRRGTFILTSFNISNTITNLFYIIFGAMATAISIMVGQSLGANKLDEAMDYDRKLIVFSCLVCLFFAVILASIAPFVPLLYKDATLEIRQTATRLMQIIAGCFVIFAFNSACFFTLRAGGVTMVTFLFDCLFVWIISIPLAYLLVKYSKMNVLLIYFIVQASEIIKSIIGLVLLKSKIWVKNLAISNDG